MMRAKCGRRCVGRTAFVISYCMQISPRACPAGRAHGGFVHSFLHKSLGLRLSDLCVLCRNMVFKTIFIEGGASGLACELARAPKAQKNP